MDNFNDNSNQLYKINRKSTIKDYFDGLTFYEERYFENIRRLLVEAIMASLIGLLCCLIVFVFMNVITFQLSMVISYLFLIISFCIVAIVLHNFKLCRLERNHFEYSMKTLIGRLIEDGVTINEKELKTDVGMNSVFLRYRKEMLAAIVSGAVFIMAFLSILLIFIGGL